MLSFDVPECHHQFVAAWLPESSLRMCPTSYLVLRNTLAASSHHGGVNLLSFNCFCRNLSMHCCTVLVIVPITQLGSSSSLSLPCSISSSSSSSLSSQSSELARSLRLSPIATSISLKVFSGSLDIDPAMSACVISSCSCWTAASAPSTRLLAPVVSLSP